MADGPANGEPGAQLTPIKLRFKLNSVPSSPMTSRMDWESSSVHPAPPAPTPVEPSQASAVVSAPAGKPTPLGGLDALDLLASAAGAVQPAQQSPVARATAAKPPLPSTPGSDSAMVIDPPPMSATSAISSSVAGPSTSAALPAGAGTVAPVATSVTGAPAAKPKPKRIRPTKSNPNPTPGPGKAWRKGLRGTQTKPRDDAAATVAGVAGPPGSSIAASSPAHTPELEDGASGSAGSAAKHSMPPVAEPIAAAQPPADGAAAASPLKKKRAPPGQSKKALARAEKAAATAAAGGGTTAGAVATAAPASRVFPVGQMPKITAGVLNAQVLEPNGPVVRRWRLGKRSLQSISGHSFELKTWQGANDSPYAVARRAAIAAQAEAEAHEDEIEVDELAYVPGPSTSRSRGLTLAKPLDSVPEVAAPASSAAMDVDPASTPSVLQPAPASVSI